MLSASSSVARPSCVRLITIAVALAVLALPSSVAAQLIVGPGPGGTPEVHVIDEVSTRSLMVYAPTFLGGVNVTLGDVNGDGTVDIITGAGQGGGPHVRVFNGTDLSPLASFFAYSTSFTGGVYVAAGDINGDGLADIITGAGQGGGPHVKVFSGENMSLLAAFFPYNPAFTGGVRVASGDVNGDGRADILVAAGPGGGPHVQVFNGMTFGHLASFFAYDSAFRGGVTVAAGDVDGDGMSDIITGAGPGGGPNVRVFSGNGLAMLANFNAYAAAFRGGVGVAAGDLNEDGRTDIITGAGPGGGPHVKAFSGMDLSEIGSFLAPVSGSGVSVGSRGDAGVRFTSAASATFVVGSPSTFTITTAGSPVPLVTLTGLLPAGVTFTDNGDGTAVLAGTPAAGAAGEYPLTFTADNGVNPPVTQSFTLAVNEGPAVTSASTTTFNVGAAASFTVTTTGFPLPTIVRGGATLPSGITFVDNGNGTGTLSGTPAAGTAGAYALSFTASNGLGNAVQSFTLNVTDGPAFTSAASTTFTAASPGSFTVTTTGSPAPALSLSGTLPAGVTFVDNGSGTATLSGTPGAGTGGTYPLTITATNSGGTATQPFTLTVNEAPAVTSAASTTFTVGTAGSFTVTTSGVPVPTIARGGVALPSGLTFVDNGNGTGTLSGTPAAGTGGTYALTFTATNSVGSSAAQSFTLTVNQAPAITSANSTSFVVGTPGSFTVTTTGFPAPALSLTGTLPTGVTFVDNGNGTGTLSGTPAAGTAGSYPLTFTASNGVLPNATQSFTLNVQQAPAITSLDNATFTVGTPGTFTVTTTGFPAPTVSQTGTLPTGVTFTPATGVLAGTPTQTGAFPLVLTAANGVPPDATQNFTLSVVCPAIAVTPSSLTDGLYQTAYGPIDFNATGSTGSTFLWGASGLPAGLNIDASTGMVSGSPDNTVLAAAVVISVTDNFGCAGTLNTTITVRPVADDDPYVGGVGNTQFAVGVIGITTPHVAFSDNVKNGDAGPATLAVTFAATSTNGGTIVEGTTDGTFVYTPPLSFGGPSDSFQYTLTDGNGVTNTATVTIDLSNLVWYVNSSGGAGDGRSHNPFNTLTAAGTASSAGSIIYVHTGAATTTGNLTMDANQTLHGAGAAFTLNSLSILAGTRPTLTGTVTLANNDVVRAVNFSGVAPALTATGVTAPVTIDQVDVTGGTTALLLSGVSGAVTVTNANFTNTSAAEVLISGGTGAVTIDGTINSNAGRSIDIQGRTGGTVVFSRQIVDVGQGIFLNNNTGSTINFTGGITLNTGANPAFTATGGGTVNVTQNNTSIVNTITTTTGTALNVANTTIGASGLTFRSISANGAANGIVLNTTGATAGLTMTGNGGVCTSATPTCTGGRIQNTTGADDSSATPIGTGIVLNNTRSVSLSLMRLDNHSNFAIRGTGVQGFTMANTVIDGINGNNDGFDEGAVSFTNLTGSASITNSSIGGAIEHNVQVLNSSGTLNRLTVSGTTFGAMDTTFGSDGLLVESSGTAVMNVTVDTNTFTSARGDHFQYSNTTAAQTGDVVFTNNTITNAHPAVVGGGGGIRVTAGNNTGQNGSITFNVSGNSIRGARGTALAVNKLGGTGTFSGTIANNIVGVTGVDGSGSLEGSGIFVLSDGGGTYTASITGNTVRQYDNDGIFMQTGGSGVVGSGTMNVTVTGNTVTEPEIQVAGALATNGFHLNGGTTVGDTYQICLNLSGNTLAGSGQDTIPAGSTFGDFRLRQRQSTTVRLPGYAGSATDTAAVVAFIQNQNPGAESGVAAVNSPPGGGFVGGAACPIP